MEALKLLVVEDDIPSLELMTEVFTSLKADAQPVQDSQQAADIINEQKFDGIFLDLEMPRLNGFDLARLIRKSSWNKSTPIVIVTGRDDKHTMQEAFAAGATFFLQKPIDWQRLNRLFRTVRGGLLDNRRRHVRVSLHTNVTCETGSKTLRGMTWNLSRGGMQIEVTGLPVGNKVRLSFRLPVSDVAIEAEGSVVWSDENRQGIRFINLHAKSEQAIAEFLSSVDK